jgi:hypothetical protein
MFRYFVVAAMSLLIFGCGPDIDCMPGIKFVPIQIEAFQMALDQHYRDTGEYPSQLAGLVTNLENNTKWQGPYLGKIPLDPWGHPYVYRRNSNPHMHPEITSYGAPTPKNTR